MKKITLLLLMTIGLFMFCNGQVVVWDENNESPATVGDGANTLGYQTSGGSATIELGTATGLNSGGNQVVKAIHATSNDLYLRSKNLAVAPGDVFTVQFDISTTNGVHVVSMRYTTDDSAVGAFANQPDSPATTTNGMQSGANIGRIVENNPGEVTTTSATFTAPAGTYNNCRIQIYNFGTANTVEVDNWRIEKTSALSITDLEKFNFKSYPNPTTDYISISAAKNINKVEVYDLLGKQVLTKTITDTRDNINVSNLTAGLYIMKAYIEDAQGTFKFVKQ
ncbi:T9SS type A sorting domain-containing protein [Gaetbulibacter sp. M240]|uniref:T9SS type A sorting domain-containing protein n=1 Tax=Gaetbulibacter sp. M240 TaxID=3126511 RepID=UPI00374EE609